jgi:hypothetical protein
VSPIELIVLWATFLCNEILYFLTITQQFSGLKNLSFIAVKQKVYNIDMYVGDICNAAI